MFVRERLVSRIKIIVKKMIYRIGFCSVIQRDIQIGEKITEDYSKYILCNWLKK